MKLSSFLLSLTIYVFLSTVTHSQIGVETNTGVGINTTEPRTTLEVGGDMYISEEIKINQLNTVESTDQAVLLAQTAGDFIKESDATQTGAAIAYFQEYRITYMDGDWVFDLNTNIPSNNYVMAILSAYYNSPLKMSSNNSNFAIPYISAFIKDNTWHITADYPSADPGGNVGTWVISTLILSKEFSRNLPAVSQNLNGGTSGTATTPVID